MLARVRTNIVVDYFQISLVFKIVCITPQNFILRIHYHVSIVDWSISSRIFDNLHCWTIFSQLIFLHFFTRSRLDFQRDVRILAALEDHNIARVLGMCSQEEPLCVIMEYLEHGDLCQFLRSHGPSEAATTLPIGVKTLRYERVHCSSQRYKPLYPTEEYSSCNLVYLKNLPN